MKRKIKYLLYYFFGGIFEIFILPILIVPVFLARFIPFKKSIFIGMMHTNNMVYVAEAMRQKGYYVQVIPWLIPPHEIDVIPYDVNLKRKFPILYSNFIGQYILSFYIFLWAILNFDIFIIPFFSRLLDRTVLLGWLEIPFLHVAKKIVILNTYGGDVATPRLRKNSKLKYSLYNGYVMDPNYISYNEKYISCNARVLEKQADYIISAIDHVDYLDRVDDYFHLRCIDTSTIKPNYSVSNSIPVFVHAPNHRLLKGTDEIIKAIENLNKRGFPCELNIVENTSNAKLLSAIRDSDGVIDQLLLGTYARLSIESMALGKPVFCYLRDDLYQFNKIWKDCPIINVNPDTLETSLEKFLTSQKEFRLKLGKLGREYIEKYHSLEFIGERLDRIIQKLVQENPKS